MVYGWLLLFSVVVLFVMYLVVGCGVCFVIWRFGLLDCFDLIDSDFWLVCLWLLRIFVC